MGGTLNCVQPSNSKRASQRGITLVELLVGMAVGLFIAATATSLLVTHLRESRSLVVEGRLMQDLRTAADIVTRDLRRAGHWGSAGAGVWSAGATGVATNPYTALSPDNASTDTIVFRFSRDATENQQVDSNEQFGFRLRSGVIELQLGSGNWQALTDAGTLTVTRFSVEPDIAELSLADFCPTACAAGSTTCPPRLQVRSLVVRIDGRAATDSRVTRSVRSSVRLRNDVVLGACAS